MNTPIDVMSLLPLIVPLVVLQLGLMIFCLLDLFRRETVRYLPKWGWALVIILGELIGPVIYLLIGRGDS